VSGGQVHILILILWSRYIILVNRLLADRLGEHADLLESYLGREKAPRNTMPVPHTAAASVRYGVLTTLLLPTLTQSLLPQDWCVTNGDGYNS